jgi:hypothetical protein
LKIKGDKLDYQNTKGKEASKTDAYHIGFIQNEYFERASWQIPLIHFPLFFAAAGVLQPVAFCFLKTV